MRLRIFALLALAVAVAIGAQAARADSVHVVVQGTFSSVGVAPDDTGLTNLNINPGDSWTLTLLYPNGPSGFNGDQLQGSAQLTFDSNSFLYSSQTDTLYLDSPGAYGAGTTSFQLCVSNNCSNFINLYFAGSLSGPDNIAGWNGLSSDEGASPAPFEFLRNFSSGDQTDLQGDFSPTSNGSISAQDVPTPTPEPASLWLLASGLLGLAALAWRRRATA